MKRKTFFLLLLFICIVTNAQQYSRYSNTLEILRSDKTAFTQLVLVLPCPQSNEYQSIYDVDISSNGLWKQYDLEENQNKYLQLVLNESQLSNYAQNFSVGISFVHTPHTIDVNFSKFKNSDGSWKHIPEYDTTTLDYQNNCKRSGEIVVPDNSTIQTISNRIYEECNNNKLAYAEQCYEYVASNYRYLNPGTGLHPLTDLLSAGGGDCGNLSSIYISLLRAKGIPARHVVAMAANNNYHVWSEFYIQDFGWVPVDVTYKNSNPSGDYFGKCDNKMVVVQKGVAMDYDIFMLGAQKIDLLQTYSYWYWYNTPATMRINQKITSKIIAFSSIDETVTSPSGRQMIEKCFMNGKLMIKTSDGWYDLNGIILHKNGSK